MRPAPDPMPELVAQFPQQLAAALRMPLPPLPKAMQQVKQVAVFGLGGSAFGADFVRSLHLARLQVPLQVFRGYDAPACVGPNTLAIFSSYSGNTEETLSSAQQALAAGAVGLSLTSGGQLQALSAQHDLPTVALPTGYPPRSAAGFSIVLLLRLLHRASLLPDPTADIEESIGLLTDFADHNLAEELAENLHERVPVLYATEATEAVALRWRQQINENAKQLCWHHVVPEMNHNELVGWQLPRDLLRLATVVQLQCSYDHPRARTRMQVAEPLLARHQVPVHTVLAKGNSHLAQALHLLHLGDWMSVYLARLNHVQATPVQVIDHLKAELAKVPPSP